MFTTRETTHLAKAAAKARGRNKPRRTIVKVYGQYIWVSPSGDLFTED